MNLLLIPITALYAGLFALFLVFLSINAVKARRANKVSLLDGGNEAVARAFRAQGNFTEYVPLALILMLLAESSAAPFWFVHLLGLVFMTGRLMHAYSLLSSEPNDNNYTPRILGMMMTFGTLLVAGIYNIYQSVTILF